MSNPHVRFVWMFFFCSDGGLFFYLLPLITVSCKQMGRVFSLITWHSFETLARVYVIINFKSKRQWLLFSFVTSCAEYLASAWRMNGEWTNSPHLLEKRKTSCTHVRRIIALENVLMVIPVRADGACCHKEWAFSQSQQLTFAG